MILRVLCLLLLMSRATISYGIETITVTQGNIAPTPIAINYFEVDNAANNIIGNNITKVIANDLKISGLFKPISPAAFIEKKIGIAHKPLFVTWRQINANLLLNGQVIKLSADRLKISFILWDTVLGKDLVGEELEVPVKLWRRAAHKITDKIYEKITGDQGYFDTKIVYVSESGSYLKRVKRIAIMDYDGENHKYLTNGKSLVLTPRFSPKADKILYLSYIKKRPRVYMLDLKTGKESIVGDFAGMSFAPRFSSDSSKALMSIAKNGSTHIFEFNFNTKRLTQLTNGININTSPTYSPDGSKIVFNSDRSGSRQLYIMNSDGSAVERISFGGGKYTAPAWSPRGDYIAFTKMTREEGFTIGVMRPDGSGERIIASGYLVESPTWASNGRVIIFAKGGQARGNIAGRNRIYSIDLTGYNEYELLTPQDASDPEWSRPLN